MKEIQLTKGKIAIVDDEDFDYLNQWKWCASKHPDNNNYRAMTTEWVNGKSKTIYMHRLILNTPKGIDVDHKNLNPLDNRKKNLRLATKSQNSAHRKAYSKSGFKGVTITKYGKFRAMICVKGKTLHIGNFNDIKQAAKAVDKKMKELYGEYAVLNFPQELV